MIELKSVGKIISGKTILNSVTLSLQRGEVAMICGPSGSGKTTLLRTINRMEVIDSGDIMIDGVSLYDEGINLCELRSRVGIVFQHCNLFSHLTALENITLPLIRVKKLTKKLAINIAIDLMDKFSVSHRKDIYPDSLSGGEKQRIAIVRCLAMSPDVMLFDEPTSALDWRLRDEVSENIKSLADLNIAQIVVTHDLDFACATGNRFFMLNNGTLTEVDCNTLACQSTDRVGRLANSVRQSSMLEMV